MKKQISNSSSLNLFYALSDFIDNEKQETLWKRARMAAPALSYFAEITVTQDNVIVVTKLDEETGSVAFSWDMIMEERDYNTFVQYCEPPASLAASPAASHPKSEVLKFAEKVRDTSLKPPIDMKSNV